MGRTNRKDAERVEAGRNMEVTAQTWCSRSFLTYAHMYILMKSPPSDGGNGVSNGHDFV